MFEFGLERDELSENSAPDKQYSQPGTRATFSEDATMRRSTIFFSTAMASLALFACGQKGASNSVTMGSGAAGSGNVSVAASTPVATGDTAILAAAEPFEKLTETAFSAKPDVLDVTIGEVNDAAKSVHGSLTGNTSPQLDERLAAITAARRSNDRADLAIAAVEGYRVLVSSVSSSAKVPTAVNLLDYAGFRFDADLKARPTRWADTAQAATFAGKQWASISSRVTDTALRARVEQTVAEMSAASKARNAPAATAAVKLELTLVDDLETFFNKQ